MGNKSKPNLPHTFIRSSSIPPCIPLCKHYVFPHTTRQGTAALSPCCYTWGSLLYIRVASIELSYLHIASCLKSTGLFWWYKIKIHPNQTKQINIMFGRRRDCWTYKASVSFASRHSEKNNSAEPSTGCCFLTRHALHWIILECIGMEYLTSKATWLEWTLVDDGELLDFSLVLCADDEACRCCHLYDGVKDTTKY